MSLRNALHASVLAAACLPALAQTPLGSEFTYQGRLEDAGVPANGLYDLHFQLHDAMEGGSKVGFSDCFNDVNVIDGLFTVTLNPAAPFTGDKSFLEIWVRPSTGLNCSNREGYVTLAPRQEMTATPNALFAKNAQSVPVPLTLSGDQPNGPVIHGENASGGLDSSGVFGLATAPSGFTNGVHGQSASASGRAVFGEATAATGTASGGLFKSVSTSGTGVKGLATTSTGTTYGGWFESASTEGTGVYGDATASTGLSYGVYGRNASSSGRGVYGDATASTGLSYGVYGRNASSSGRGVFGWATSTTGATAGVRGQTSSSSGRGVFGWATPLTGDTTGVWGESASDDGDGVFGWATATSGETFGVRAISESAGGRGVLGLATANTGINYGVWGLSYTTTNTGAAVRAEALGTSGLTYAVRGTNESTEGTGVSGWAKASTGTTYGVRGATSSSAGYDFYAGGSGIDFGSTSSRRWKSNIQSIDRPLEKLARLRGVYYDWDAEHGGHHDVGMVAEEVGQVLPEIVRYEENGADAIGMDYSKMTPLLVEAVNALRAEKDKELSEHRARIALLEEENSRLTAQSAALSARLDEFEAALSTMAALDSNQVREHRE